MSFEERLNVAEELARFTEQGFMEKVREIADALSICPKDDVKVISEQLSLAVNAMAEADKDVTYLRGRIKKKKGE